MTQTSHALVSAQLTAYGFRAGCECGYRSQHCRTKQKAENRAEAHVQLSTRPPRRTITSRPAIDIEDAADRFLDLLLWGLDENVSASRGGWPR